MRPVGLLLLTLAALCLDVRDPLSGSRDTTLLLGAVPRSVPAPNRRIHPADDFPLVRGVNVRTVLSPGAIPGVIADLTSPEEVRRLSALGFTFVRLPLAPERFFPATGEPDLSALTTLETILDQLSAGHVAAIVEIHGDDSFKQRVLATDSSVARFAAFWKGLAVKLAARYSPGLLAFEPLNEPFTRRGAAVTWNVAQTTLWTTLRGAAPQHLIVLSGEGGSQIEGLARIDPVPDVNVVYTFHFYEPTTFTDQGANWPGVVQRHLSRVRELPYPASCPGVRSVLATLRPASVADSLTGAAAQAVAAYRATGWDRASVESRIAVAARWGRDHHVRVFAGEFGTFRNTAPSGSRYRWLRDVRQALDNERIPWALWEYKGGFGLLQDSKTVDELAAEALGLTSSKEFARRESNPCW